MEQEEARQPPRRLVGIDLGIASRHSVRVLEADGQVVCRSSCVPAVASLAAAERAALAGAPRPPRAGRGQDGPQHSESTRNHPAYIGKFRLFRIG